MAQRNTTPSKQEGIYLTSLPGAPEAGDTNPYVEPATTKNSVIRQKNEDVDNVYEEMGMTTSQEIDGKLKGESSFTVLRTD